MRLKTRFWIFGLLVFVSLAAAVSVIQFIWVDRLVIQHTSSRMKDNIKSAWQLLDDQKRQLELVVAFLAEKEEIQLAVEAQEPTAASRLLDQSRDRWGLDVLVLVPKTELQTDPRTSDAITPRGESKTMSGFCIIDRKGIVPAPALGFRDNTMLLFAAHRLCDSQGNLCSILLAGIDLARTVNLVDEIQDNIFQDRFHREKRVGTATIFLGIERIATTVLLESGQRAIGTVVSNEVAQQTLRQGIPWTGRALVVDDWYLSRYEPIRDPHDEIIGMLYIGELEQLYLDQRQQILLANLGALFAVMGVLLWLGYVFGAKILKQIGELEHATRRFAAGHLTTRVEVDSPDEIGDLARSFNAMAEVIEDDRHQLLDEKQKSEQVNANYLEMLGFVTHELRSSLASAIFNVELLKDGTYGDLQGDQEEGVELVENSLTYLTDLTNNYLQLSRIEKGELIINKTSVTLRSDVVVPVVNGLQSQLDAREMTVDVEIPHELSVPADVNLIRVVVENLVGNAIKYGQDRGQVRVTVDELENEYAISVWNSGKPIQQAHLGTLFRKFQRYDVDETTGRKGTGLGLFIVNQIVTVHGGEVTVESSQETGTRFTFTLPR